MGRRKITFPQGLGSPEGFEGSAGAIKDIADPHTPRIAHTGKGNCGVDLQKVRRLGQIVFDAAVQFRWDDKHGRPLRSGPGFHRPKIACVHLGARHTTQIKARAPRSRNKSTAQETASADKPDTCRDGIGHAGRYDQPVLPDLTLENTCRSIQV